MRPLAIGLFAAYFSVSSGLCAGGTRKLPYSEKLVYDVYWKFINVGYGTLEIKGVVDFRGRKAYSICSESVSAPFFDFFFKVRDTNYSWVDAENFYSLAFEQHIREGGFKRNRRINYDQAAHTAVNNKGESFGIPANVLDVLAALYRVRTLDLRPDSAITVAVNSGKKNYDMRVKIDGRDTVEVAGKKINALIVEPELQDTGIFMNKGALIIWFSDDENHIPLKMQSEISVGSIMAVLNGLPSGYN